MQAMDIVGPEGPDPRLRNAIIHAAFYRGLLLLGCGRAGIRFCPALCVSPEQVDIALELLRQAVLEPAIVEVVLSLAGKPTSNVLPALAHDWGGLLSRWLARCGWLCAPCASRHRRGICLRLRQRPSAADERLFQW